MTVTLIFDRATKQYYFYQHANDDKTSMRLAMAKRKLRLDYDTTMYKLRKDITDEIRIQLLKDNNIQDYEENPAVTFRFDSMKED